MVSSIDLLYGGIVFLFVIISLGIGLRIIIKSRSVLNKTVQASFGFAWIFMCSGWWGGALSFFLYILFGIILDSLFMLVVQNIFIPLAIICLIYSVFSLIYEKYKIKLLSIYLVICILYEIYFILFFMFLDKNTILEIEATRRSIFLVSYQLFVTIVFNIFAVFSGLIIGFLFSNKLLKSDKKESVWRGRFLMSGFILFCSGAILESFVLPPILWILVGALLITSSIFYEFGLFLPEKLKKTLLKND